MERELIICIPGPWTDRTDLIRQVVTLDPGGRYMFAGIGLADIQAQDHVPLDFCEADPQIQEAFEIAGQGKISAEVMAELQRHSSVVYLHFPVDLPDQRERVLKFTQIFQRLGGIAVKLETVGIAHTWERWFKLLSGSPFDVYCSAVVLVAGENCYYSSGMHHFGLPECAAPKSIPVSEAAEVMNQFNFWQIVEHPELASGHIFSLTETDPKFRITLESDSLNPADAIHHNPHGVWQLSPG
jgi:hypothetical protein